jgi:hypothetical protein
MVIAAALTATTGAIADKPSRTLKIDARKWLGDGEQLIEAPAESRCLNGPGLWSQEARSNERVDFGFAQFNSDVTQSLALTPTVPMHAHGGRRAVCRRRIHHLRFPLVAR